jgi:hypothetical protein
VTWLTLTENLNRVTDIDVPKIPMQFLKFPLHDKVGIWCAVTAPMSVHKITGPTFFKKQ